jgi:hypothetical protein
MDRTSASSNLYYIDHGTLERLARCQRVMCRWRPVGCTHVEGAVGVNGYRHPIGHEQGKLNAMTEHTPAATVDEDGVVMLLSQAARAVHEEEKMSMLLPAGA